MRRGKAWSAARAGAAWLCVAGVIAGGAAAQTQKPPPSPAQSQGQSQPDLTQPTDAQFIAAKS